MRSRKDKKRGSEKRQPTGARERNVAHPNGEEHSRVPKGNQRTKYETFLDLVGVTFALSALAFDDFTGVGTVDDELIISTLTIWWDLAWKLFE